MVVIVGGNLIMSIGRLKVASADKVEGGGTGALTVVLRIEGESVWMCVLGKHFLPVLRGSPGNQAFVLGLAPWLNLVFHFGSFWCIVHRCLGCQGWLEVKAQAWATRSCESRK